MSTRGLVGFVISGQVKCTYNHFDSYPTHTGLRIAEFVRGCEDAGLWNSVEQQVRALRLIDPDSGEKPTEDEKLHLLKWANFDINAKSADEWYCLLRGTQGRPEEMLEAGIIEDSLLFGLHSRWCEWGYLIDIDRRVLEVYRGSIYETHPLGRWVDGRITWPADVQADLDEVRADPGHDDYDVAIRLIAEVDFSDLWSASGNETLMRDLQAQGRELSNLQWDTYKQRTGL